MAPSRNKLNLGLTILVFLSVVSPFGGTVLAYGSAHSPIPPFFSLLPAPPLQSTLYPPPQTEVTTSGYPEPPTATTAPGNQGTQTATPGSTSSSTPLPNQTAATLTPTQATGTPTQTPTAGKDIFLTENAEMGQSQATSLPTETPSPSATLTATPTSTLKPAPPTTAVPLDESFAMNWGVFLIAFLGTVVIGGAAWLAFLKRFILPKA